MRSDILETDKRDDGFEFNLKALETLAQIELLEESVEETKKLALVLKEDLSREVNINTEKTE